MKIYLLRNKQKDLKIKIGKTVYVMTEKHRYKEILPRLKELEPKTFPIKDVTVEKKGLMATGYKIPSNTGFMDSIIKVIKEANPVI